MRTLRAKGQSDESLIISKLATDTPRTFVEFGFHPIQFNCACLARDQKWQGLLIDGNQRYVSDARSMFSDRIKVLEMFLTLENLDVIKSAFSEIGILSIDVDGNDYWFLERLIDSSPSIICVEYNSTFGLEPITVPYDRGFDRHQKHPSGWYHGASITALSKLCAKHGYGLAAVSRAGSNAFFTRDGRLNAKDAWLPNLLREQYSGTPHPAQWQTIEHMPYSYV